MIYITGDCHSDFKRFSKDIFPEQMEMDKDDYVIICGDFGGVWDEGEESAREKWWMDWLEEKPFTTLFVDGNHENFDRLYGYPVEEWKGGKVHKIRPSVIHLMRGQVFTINDKKIFTFGGARSHDISGGILEPKEPEYRQKKKELDKDWLPYRINHISWWKEEMPSKEEMDEGRKNLLANNNKVDFMVSHCCPASALALFSQGRFKPDELNNYFEELCQNIKYKKWFFGHYHDNLDLNSKEILLYEQIIRIA